MNRVIAAFKRIRLGQILMAFVAGVLLFVSSACSNAPDLGAQAKNPRPEVPGGTAISPNPDVINTYKGGMNDFNDLDPRQEPALGTIGEKAAALKENAERNVIDQTGNLGENTKRILDKKGENVEDLGKNVSQSAENTKNKVQSTADDLTKGAKQAVENAKDNTVGATRDLTRSASQTADDVKQSTRNAANDLSRGTNRAVEDVKGNAKDTGNSLIDKAQQAIENTGEFVQSKLNQSGDAVRETADTASQKTLNKVGNAINDALE